MPTAATQAWAAEQSLQVPVQSLFLQQAPAGMQVTVAPTVQACIMAGQE
jgi:hypothetical protein